VDLAVIGGIQFRPRKPNPVSRETGFDGRG
jgi:hypothetical protein